MEHGVPAASAHAAPASLPRVPCLSLEVCLATWVSARLPCFDLLPTLRLELAAESIPQVADVSARLRDLTGWSIKPVAGLLHPRDFLNGLAFRVFHSTFYLRSPRSPGYTPEPDLVHELIGHVPLLSHMDYAELLRLLGQASLGASEPEIRHLTRIYWYTAEYGLVWQEGLLRAFGAGILSSAGELSWLASGNATVKPLDCYRRLPKISYKNGFQPLYFSVPSFRAGREILSDFAAAMIRDREAGRTVMDRVSD